MPARCALVFGSLTAIILACSLDRTVAADKPIGMGDAIANLSFKDIHYLPRSLDDFKQKKAFVLVFANTTCPLVQRYWPELCRMEKEYRSKDVQFVAVNVAAEDSIAAMAAQAVRYECAFPFVKDVGWKCTAALGVQRTPEAVVLDGHRRLRYRGRIDDQYRLGGNLPAPTRRELKEAIDAVLAGREVEVKETPVDGCQITRAEPRTFDKPITYAEHIAPLMQKHCSECHRDNASAPFALTNYQQVAAKANTIAEVVADERMPPWYGSPDHKEFVNRRGMTADERELVAAWVRGGKPMGDESKLPDGSGRVVAASTNSWRMGEPDLVLNAPEHELPADGDVPYRYAILPHGFEADTWVQGIQIRPDNPRVLHHCNMGYVKFGENFQMSNFITGTVPGGEPMTLTDGVGFCIPKGAVLALQIHYVTTGKPEKCRISVGLRYAREVIQKQLKFTLMDDHRFSIPPGAPAHPVSATRTLSCDAVGVGLFCHMHLRGRDMTFRAHYPDGTSETLLVIPNYNFDWQMPYRWEPGKKRFAKGTRLECIAHYDNSPFNPFNPDPTATVRDGQQTRDEMINGFVFFTDADERLNLTIDPKTGHVK
jgi:thiol-disulfide isomerase/thioredoxin